MLYPDAIGLPGANRIELREGSEIEGFELKVRRSPRFSLRGRLLDAENGGPAQAKFLRAYSADMIGGTFVDGSIHNGEFRLEGVRPGRHFLNFTWVGETNNVSRSAVFPVEVGDADQNDLILRMARTRISGRVETGGHLLPSNLSVYLEPTAAVIRARISGSEGTSDVAPDGTFEIAGVTNGEYTLRVHTGEPESFFAHEKTLIVDGRGPVIEVTLDLDFSAGSVSGKALLPEGATPAFVVLQSDNPGKLTNPLYRHVHRIGPNGGYWMTGVVPGEYLLFAWRGDPGLIGDPALFEQAHQGARHVTVSQGGSLTLDAPEIPSPDVYEY